MIAVVCAFVLLAAGCGTAGNRGGQDRPAASSPTRGSGPPGLLPPEPAAGPNSPIGATDAPQGAATTGPTLTPATPAAPADLPRQEPAVPPHDTAEQVLAAAGLAAPTTTQPTKTAQPTTTTAAAAEEAARPTPEGGHPPAPTAGMVPREHPYWDYPNCAPGPPWPSDCYPPSEWEVPQNLAGCFGPDHDAGVGGICASRQPDEIPRWTIDVVRWTSWCYNQPSGNCRWLLFEMKWALDYLGAHPWCVLNEYQDRVNAYTALQGGAGPPDIPNRHGWHRCATVIDPLAKDAPSGSRTSDADLLLSGTVSLAGQCRIVLPADIELETMTDRLSDEPERFGSDCDAWADWVQNRPRARDQRDCDRSARLAEEWMEHHLATPETYYPVNC